MASCVLLSSLPDEDIVRRCCLGEDDAFAMLYDRYRRRVLLTAYRIMRDPDDAQDATQEIFLKAYLSLPQWNSAKSKLSTWLYRLAENHAIDCWRAQKRRLRLQGGCCSAGRVITTEPGSDPGCGPELDLMQKEQIAECRKLVDALPQMQRRLFVLRHFYGLSLAEIANKEGRSLGTVKGSLHRATRFVTRRLRRHRELKVKAAETPPLV